VVAGPFASEDDAAMSGQDDENDVLVPGNNSDEALAKYHEIMSTPSDQMASAAKASSHKLVEAKKKGKRVNPWAVCHTTVDKDKNPDKYERCVMDVKKEHPVKESAEDTAKQVILAGGRENFIKISSKIIEATAGDENVIRAFSMAIDFFNDGITNEEAAIKVASATGMPIDKVVSIQAIALQKMAEHVSDAYVVEEDDASKKSQPRVATREEAKETGEELAI
jgi:hypothetical protein